MKLEMNKNTNTLNVLNSRNLKILKNSLLFPYRVRPQLSFPQIGFD